MCIYKHKYMSYVYGKNIYILELESRVMIQFKTSRFSCHKEAGGCALIENIARPFFWRLPQNHGLGTGWLRSS